MGGMIVQDKYKLSGRDYLKKYSFLVNILIYFFRIFPFLISFIKYLFGNKSGRLSILIRYLWVKIYILKTGENIYLAPMVVMKNIQNIEIENNLSIHEFCYIDAIGGIKIGDNVSIAHNCSLVSFEHTWDDLTNPIKYNPTKLKSIKIGNDVWLGCGVRVLAGTVIEDRVVVAAGAVAKGTLESGYLYGGIPAKKLKKL